jgi:hypothetical protein
MRDTTRVGMAKGISNLLDDLLHSAFSQEAMVLHPVEKISSTHVLQNQIDLLV